jgi:hypothetical protein
MLLIYGNEQAWTEAERQACFQESTELAHQINRSSQFLACSPLQSISTATSVRVRDGKAIVTDGPFAETREQLGGYFLIEAENMDSAVKIAAQIPGARKGTVEVRPLVEVSGLPAPG